MSRAGSSIVVARISSAQDEFNLAIAGGGVRGLNFPFIGAARRILDSCTAVRQVWPAMGQTSHLWLSGVW
jgi:hypothetical protein